MIHLALKGGQAPCSHTPFSSVEIDKQISKEMHLRVIPVYEFTSGRRTTKVSTCEGVDGSL